MYQKHCRRTEIKDLKVIAEGLKGDDLKEIEIHGYSPLEAVQLSHLTSDKCFTMLSPITGEPIGLFGISSEVPDIGNIWALTTPEIFNHPITLHKATKSFIKDSLKEYPILSNYIWSGNENHIRWLRALGFVFLSDHTTINNNKFYEFVRI